METELPPGEEPDPVPIEDSDRWSDHHCPQFIQEDTGGETDTYEDCAAENATVHRASDGRDWWSYSYKQARRFLYGTEEEKPDFRKAMPLLRMEARGGNGYACYDLGRMYLLWLGCDADEEEAQTWFRNALEAFQKAEQTAEKKGYLRYRIGKCHAHGHGTEQNYEESARWFRQWMKITHLPPTRWEANTSGGRAWKRAIRRHTDCTPWRQSGAMHMHSTSLEGCTGMVSGQGLIWKTPSGGMPKHTQDFSPWKRLWQTISSAIALVP